MITCSSFSHITHTLLYFHFSNLSLFHNYYYFITIKSKKSNSQDRKAKAPFVKPELPPLSETYPVFDWGDFREAAFLFEIEKNSDVVEMASYAPLFVNANNWR